MAISPWIRNKINDAISYTSNSYAQIKSVANYFWASSFKNDAKAYSLEGLEGFTVPLHLREVYSFIANAPQSRKIFFHTLSSNIIFYLANVLLYEGVIKPSIRMLSPDIKNSFAEDVMDVMATWYFIRQAISLLVENGFYNSALNRAISSEFPSSTKKICNPEKVMKGDFEESIFFASKLITARLVDALLPQPFNLMASTFLRGDAYGEGMLSYQLTELCTKHRSEIKLKNNAYTLGLGLSFLAALWMNRNLFKLTTGIDNVFVYDAMFFPLFQYFMIATRVSNHQFSGKTKGLDFFYYSKEITQDIFKKISELIITNLPRTETKMDWPRLKADLSKYKNTIENFPLVSIPSKIFLVPELRSFQQFAKLEPMQYWFDLIQKKIEWIMKLRNRTLIYYVPGILLSQKSKLALEIILADGMGDLLKDMHQFINDSRYKIVDHSKRDEKNNLIVVDDKKLSIINKYEQQSLSNPNDEVKLSKAQESLNESENVFESTTKTTVQENLSNRNVSNENISNKKVLEKINVGAFEPLLYDEKKDEIIFADKRNLDIKKNIQPRNFTKENRINYSSASILKKYGVFIGKETNHQAENENNLSLVKKM